LLLLIVHDPKKPSLSNYFFYFFILFFILFYFIFYFYFFQKQNITNTHKFFT